MATNTSKPSTDDKTKKQNEDIPFSYPKPIMFPVPIPEPTPDDSNLRYLAYIARLRTIVMASSRYMAFTSDVGEAFRPVVPVSIVRTTYAISWGYCAFDVAYEGYHDYKNGKSNEEVTRTVIKRSIFQTFASMLLPALTIHTAVSLSSKFLFKKRFNKWGPTITGIAVVPLLPFMFDAPSEFVLDYIFERFWPIEEEGKKEEHKISTEHTAQPTNTKKVKAE